MLMDAGWSVVFLAVGLLSRWAHNDPETGFKMKTKHVFGWGVAAGVWGIILVQDLSTLYDFWRLNHH